MSKMSANNLCYQTVLDFVDSFTKLIYDDRSCKIHQVTYCHISGVSSSKKDGLILYPGSLYINGSIINSIVKHGETWHTDADSNNKSITLKPCECLQVDHQSALKKIGLPQEISRILKSPFIYQDSRTVIGGTVSALLFTKERGERFIRIIPNRAKLRDPMWGLKPIEYFEYHEDHWSAMSKRQSTSNGTLELI